MPTPAAESSPRPVRIILHGKRADDEEIRAAVELYRDRGYEIDVRVTYEAGDGERLARESVEAGVGTVVAAGGDGTIHEVASGLVQATAIASGTDIPSLGVIPLGTGNDFAAAARIPDEPVEALDIVLQRPAQPVDLGWVNGRSFLNMATGGFGTDVTASTPAELKQVLGRMAYLLTGLANMTSIEPVDVRVVGPDFEWAGPLLLLAVGNGRFAGGGRHLCPEALIDDGVFDLRVVPEVAESRIGTAVRAILKGGLSELETHIIAARLPWLEVTAPDGLHVNLDGEPISGTEFRFEIQRKGLRVHLPLDSPLVAP